MEKRNETKFDSVYEFGNYITAGGLDVGKGFASGLNERAEVATESGSDFINYLTMGGMDLFNGAVNPDDSYSKEHWLNSFGLAALLVGGAKPGLNVKGGTNISTPAAKTVPKVSLNQRWDQIRLGIDDLWNRPMMVADNGMLVGGEPGWSRFSVDKAVKEREIGTGDRVGTKGTGKDVEIPSIRNNEFNMWFDSISVDEFDQMWSVPHLRSKIEDRIRRPGGYHEWHLVARTPKFKRWGVSMDDIKEMRSLTKDVEFVNPPGRHGRRGSTKAHNEILKIIDTAPDYESFVKRLNEWASNRMKNGVMDLPEGLRR
jgi:hypothetical protein